MGNGHSSNNSENGHTEFQYSEDDVSGLLNIRRKIYEKKCRAYEKAVSTLKAQVERNMQATKTAESVVSALSVTNADAYGHMATCAYSVLQNSQVSQRTQATQTTEYVQTAATAEIELSSLNVQAVLHPNVIENPNTEQIPPIVLKVQVGLKLQGTHRTLSPNREDTTQITQAVPKLQTSKNVHENVTKVQANQNAQTCQNSFKDLSDAEKFQNPQAAQTAPKDCFELQGYQTTHNLPKSQSLHDHQAAVLAQIMKNAKPEIRLSKELPIDAKNVENAKITLSTLTKTIQNSQIIQAASNRQNLPVNALNRKRPAGSKHLASTPKLKRSVLTNSEYELGDISSNSQNVYLILVRNFNFFLHVKVSEPDRKICMAVQLAGTERIASRWTYEVHVYDKSDARRKFTFSDTCTSHAEPVAALFSEGRCCVIPHAYASTFLHNGIFTYKISIKETTNNRSLGYYEKRL